MVLPLFVVVSLLSAPPAAELPEDATRLARAALRAWGDGDGDLLATLSRRARMPGFGPEVTGAWLADPWRRAARRWGGTFFEARAADVDALRVLFW